MVACKTVSEYKRNQEKIKKLCLEEAKQHKKTGKQYNQLVKQKSIDRAPETRAPELSQPIGAQQK